MKSTLTLIFLIFTLAVYSISGQPANDIIPKPQKLISGKGVFTISPSTVIFASGELLSKARQMNEYLSPALGFNLAIIPKKGKTNFIELKIDNSLVKLGNEGYILEINPDIILLKAYNEKGIFWGIQTIRQLLPEQILRSAEVKGVQWIIPCYTIEDNPRYEWRGLMLDCSRTFITKEQIKKYLEAMSFFKMNVLHMHLTDDQGWRLQIRKYPELTDKASKFHPSFGEPLEYQGFYSQDDIRELVKFAAKINIEIVPEIEMPGHTSEVFSVFPNLTCKSDTSMIRPWSKDYSVTNPILCAGNEETFKFIENVLDEVVELFPSEYIHIGGDEAPKLFWKECPKCQKRIAEEGLKDENELQSWFIKRIENYLTTKGKKLVGWDEITEGGLSKSATVMYWRGWMKNVPKKVTDMGNNIIMTPTSHCYLDTPLSTISTEKVYSLNPPDLGVAPENINKILGVQGNFWSHLDRTPPRIDRQLFPRLIALSEAGWTNNEKKDWNDFKGRLKTRLISLDLMGIYYNIDQKDLVFSM